jgi:hypothetical protein
MSRRAARRSGYVNLAVGRKGYDRQWHLAPAAMAWQGRPLAEICEQIKDRARNGDRDMAALIHHLAEDSLVGWAWSPGGGRDPAPGSQAQFGELMKAWQAAGAHCPG